VNRPPLSISRIVKHLGAKQYDFIDSAANDCLYRGRIVVVAGTVTDDKRLLDVPKLQVAALRFTETARARILKAGGKCLTLD
jgi:large subunit ribosomal protein L18e